MISPTFSQCYEVEGVHRQCAIARTPVKVRAGYSPCRSNQSYHLAALDGVALRDESLAHVKVRGNNSVSVVDVHNVAGEKQTGNERHDTAVGCNDAISRTSPEIDSEVPAGECAVEH